MFAANESAGHHLMEAVRLRKLRNSNSSNSSDGAIASFRPSHYVSKSKDVVIERLAKRYSERRKQPRRPQLAFIGKTEELDEINQSRLETLERNISVQSSNQSATVSKNQSDLSELRCTSKFVVVTPMVVLCVLSAWLITLAHRLDS